MHNYKELEVWKTGIDFAVEVYSLTKSFPKEELYGLTSQINRSALSIASNIAEGAGRNTKKDFARFLSIAMGSAYEVETQLIISHRLGLVPKETKDMLFDRIDHIQKMIYKLKNNLREK